MRWIALTAGRRVARLLLHPIVCCTSSLDRRRRAPPLGALPRRARSAAPAHLARRLPPPPHLRRRPCSTASTCCRSASTSSRFEASGVEAIIEPFDARRRRARVRRPPRQLRGAAHDRPRQGPARGDDHVRGQRAPDQRDARRARAAAPSCTRSRSAASTRCSRSAAGSTTAASPACSPTARCPATSQRSKAVALPFLGAPALFSDGPFRLAAMLRRKVVFMAGLYRGGNRYDLRFVELADFSTLPGRRAAPSATRAIRAALRALRRDARGAVPRGALQLVQLLRLLGRCRDADAPRPPRLSDAASCAARWRAAASPRRSRSRRARARRRASTSPR